MSRVFATVVVLACCAAAALPASAARQPKDLWATINICDTSLHDNMLGVRGSMPGDGDHTRMYMRFSVQYYDRPHQAWVDVRTDGMSKWIYVGSGIYARRQSGYTFGPFPPASGQTFVMRGVVDYKWTKHRRIVRTARVVTKGGHPGTADAEPADYSASLCQIR